MSSVARPVFEVSGLSMIQVLNNAPDEVKPWTHCITIETELETIGFTSLDRSLTIGGVECIPNAAVSPSSVKKTAAIESNNLDVKGLIDSESLSDLDLRAGKFSGAKVKVFIANFLTNTIVKTLTVGRWGQVKKTDQTWEVTVRTNAEILQQSVFQSLSRSCRWSKRLEDARCGVNIASFTTTGTISEVLSGRSFVIETSNFVGWDKSDIYSWTGGGGYVFVTNGGNAGYKLLIEALSGFPNQSVTNFVQVNLLKSSPYSFAVGDVVSLVPGCNGSIVFCRYKFNNQANFGGISNGAHFFPTKEKLRQ